MLLLQTVVCSEEITRLHVDIHLYYYVCFIFIVTSSFSVACSSVLPAANVVSFISLECLCPLLIQRIQHFGLMSPTALSVCPSKSLRSLASCCLSPWGRASLLPCCFQELIFLFVFWRSDSVGMDLNGLPLCSRCVGGLCPVFLQLFFPCCIFPALFLGI